MTGTQDHELLPSLHARLSRGDDLPQLLNFMRSYAVTGGSQDAMLDALHECRQRLPAANDLICELLDVALGWCLPDRAIWNVHQRPG